jgi:hypothetical protein
MGYGDNSSGNKNISAVDSKQSASPYFALFVTLIVVTSVFCFWRKPSTSNTNMVCGLEAGKETVALVLPLTACPCWPILTPQSRTLSKSEKALVADFRERTGAT